MRSRDNFSGLTEQALKYNDQTHHLITFDCTVCLLVHRHHLFVNVKFSCLSFYYSVQRGLSLFERTKYRKTTTFDEWREKKEWHTTMQMYDGEHIKIVVSDSSKYSNKSNKEHEHEYWILPSANVESTTQLRRYLYIFEQVHRLINIHRFIKSNKCNTHKDSKAK